MAIAIAIAIAISAPEMATSFVLTLSMVEPVVRSITDCDGNTRSFKTRIMTEPDKSQSVD